MIDRRTDASTLYINVYAAQALTSNQFTQSAEDVEKIRFGLFGEVGGILAGVKKASRDRLPVSQKDAIAEELGDALWYLFALAWSLSIDAERIAAIAIKHVRETVGICGELPPGSPSFRHLDSAAQANAAPEDGLQATMLTRIAASAARLTIASDEDETSCGALLGDLALVCAAFDDSLEEIAQANLSKTAQRWPGVNPPDYGAHLDDDAELHEFERMPRNFCMIFEERTVNHKTYVVQRMGDVYIGDPLTDNHHKQDDYRFHDAFHLAYLAHLTWSPVLRGLMKRKRKSQPKTDENQDGARAMIIEEGIATWIFNYADRNKDTDYAAIKPGQLPYSLLKQISSMVVGYEVDARPLWQWERAIIDGFAMFKELKKHRNGRIRVDMDAHTIEFFPLEPPK